MTPILMAAAQGYSAQQILQYLQKAFPKLTPKILQATANGYSVDQVLKYVNKLMEGESFDSNATPHEIEAAHQKKYNEIGKKILGTAATGLGVTSFAKNLPSLVGSLGSAFGQNPPPAQGVIQSAANVGGHQIGPQPMGNAPVQPPPVPPVGGAQAVTVPSGQQTTIAPAQPQSSIPPSVATTPSLPPASSKAIIDQMAIGSQIQSLSKAGNDPQTVTAAINSILKPHQKTWLNEQIKAGRAKPMEEMVKDYLAEAPDEEQKPIEQPKASPKIVKGNTVITPEGEVGDVKSERNGKALVDVNGKLTEHKVDKLQDLYEKYKDVHIDVSHIPESERSGPLYGIRTANDNKNLLVEFFPKNSEVSDNEWEYFRKDGNKLEDSLLHSLQEGMTIPVTSGVEWSGFWSEEDADSRGSAFHHNLKLLAQDKNAVESGEEQNDPSKPYWYVKKKSLFRHGYEREARRQFGKHQKEFKKEHKEMTGGKKRRTEER